MNNSNALNQLISCSNELRKLRQEDFKDAQSYFSRREWLKDQIVDLTISLVRVEQIFDEENSLYDSHLQNLVRCTNVFYGLDMKRFSNYTAFVVQRDAVREQIVNEVDFLVRDAQIGRAQSGPSAS